MPNPHSKTDHKDALYAHGWAGAALLPMALVLYAQRKSGVAGDVIECGVFQGGSLICLSHVCDALGTKLYAADSFEGLPHGSGNGYYQQGQFLGRLNEVRENVNRFGVPRVVEYVKGWFADSLRNMSTPLAAIFLDTDLYESSIDALKPTLPLLVSGGVIFSDGVGSGRDFGDGHLLPGSDEARAIVEHLQRTGIPQRAVTTGYDFLGLVSPGCGDSEILTYTPAFAKTLIALICGQESEGHHLYAYPAVEKAIGLLAQTDIVAEMLADRANKLHETSARLAEHRVALAAVQEIAQQRLDVIQGHSRWSLDGAARLKQRLVERAKRHLRGG